MESKTEELKESKKLLNTKHQKKDKLDNSEILTSKNKKTNNENIKAINPKKNFRIIEPYRSLGVYTDNNKIHYFKRGIERFMLTSNKYSFIVYNLEKLRIERISPPLEKKITALNPYKTKIFTGIGNKVQL